MKKTLSLALALIVCLLSCAAFAQETVPGVQWTFPVPLYEIQSKYLMLINESNLLDKSYEPQPLVKVTGIKRATSAAVYLEETAADALRKMFEAAAQVYEYSYVDSKGRRQTATYGDAGMVLYLKSGYRSYGTQATTYANYLARNNNVDDGYVAKPGSSEHQSGICADVLNADYAGRPRMTQDFKWTPEAQWMKENCANYGFILRFTEDGEAQTGIKFEPWHFRYVGETSAKYIMGKGITLEAFVEDARAAYEDFVARGGDVDAWVAYELKKANQPPVSYVLDEVDAQGDNEVSLVF